MNVDKREYLSALLDDAAGDFEQRRLAEEVSKDDDLAQTMGRYALVGELMRSRSEQPVVMAKRDFLAGIQAGIAQEEEHDVPLDIDPPLPKNQTETSVVSLPQTRSKRTQGVWRYGMAAAVGAITMAGVLSQTNLLTGVQSNDMLATNNHAVVMQPQALMTSNIPTPVTTQPQAAVMMPVAATYTQQPVARMDPQLRALLKQYLAEHVRYAPTTTLAPTVSAVAYQQQ